MDLIVKEWGKVADRGNCAVELYDYTRKMGGAETEVTVESSRGGKAKTDACRVVRAINRMTKEEGARAGIDNHRLYFKTFRQSKPSTAGRQGGVVQAGERRSRERPPWAVTAIALASSPNGSGLIRLLG
jgi:hypothetical protein